MFVFVLNSCIMNVFDTVFWRDLSTSANKELSLVLRSRERSSFSRIFVFLFQIVRLICVSGKTGLT